MGDHAHHGLVFDELDVGVAAGQVVDHLLVTLLEVNVDPVQHLVVYLAHDVSYHFLVTLQIG